MFSTVARARWRALLAIALCIGVMATALSSASADLSLDGDPTAWVTDGRVFAINQVDDVIYVGGQFGAVAPDNSSGFTPRPFIAAFEADSGQFIPSFAPTLDGPVRALASSADGTQLFVSGEFGNVNGQTRNAIVSLDPVTGAINTNFAVTVGASTIYDIEVDGDRVYLGGSFNNMNGVTNASRAARVDANTGAVDASWRPRPNASVESITIPPSGNPIYLGGRFTTMGGNSAGNMAAVNAETAAFIEDYQADEVAGCGIYQPNGIRSMDATDDRIFAMPYNNNCIMVFQPGQRSRVLEYNMDGDVQVAHLVADRFFVGGHSFVVENVAQNRMYGFNLDGTFDPTMRTESGGQPGVFAYYGSGPNLWVGGTIFTLGSTSSVRDLGRVGPAPGESIPSTPIGLSATTGPGGATISWQPASDPDGIGGYRILRGNEQLAFVAGTATSYTDVRYRTGEINEYRIEAMDTRRNRSERSAPLLVGLNGIQIEDMADRTSLIGDTVNVSVNVLGANGTVAYSAAGLPDGLSISGGGDITGSPTTLGTFTPTITATDSVGTASATFQWSVVNDGIPVGPDPLVAVTSPVPGEFLESPVAISGVATDDSGVDRVRLTVRNRSTGLYLQSDQSFAATFARIDAVLQSPGSTVTAFDLGAALPAGDYHLSAVTEGVDGVRGESEEFDFTVLDALGANPHGALQFPLPRTNVYGAFSVIGTATDDIGVARVEVLVKEKFPTNAGRRLQDDYTLDAAYNTFDAQMSAPGSPVTRFWLDLPAGLPTVNPWQIRVIITDTAGNEFSETLISGFGIDGEYYAGRDAPTPYPVPDFSTTPGVQPPVVVVTSPSSTVVQPAPVVINGTVGDNLSVDAVTVRVRNDIGWYLQSGGGFASTATDLPAAVTGLGTAAATFNYDAGVLPLGDYTVEVTGFDSATLSTLATRDFSVEADPGAGSGVRIGAGLIGSEYNISNGSNLSATRDILLDAREFGPTGVYEVESLTIVEDVANMTQAYLDDIDILFNGWVEDGSWSSGELDLVESWVNAGGVLVANNDDVGHDALSTRFGNPVIAAGPATWNAIGNHPIVTGPFGTWASVQGSGNIGYFADVAGWTVVARNTSNQATIVTRQIGEGYVVLIADEGVFRTNIGGANGVMASNLFAHAIDEALGDTVVAPTINPISNQSNGIGDTVSLQVVANSPTGAVVITETGLPSGLTLDTASGLISGSPDTAEVADVTITATDSGGLAVATSFVWTIDALPDAVEPDTSVSNPVGGSTVATGLVSFDGNATDDNSGVTQVRVAVRDRDTNLWLQADGTFAGSVFLADAVLGSPGSTSTSWSYEVALPVGRFAVIPRAVDAAGNTETDRPWTGFLVADPITDVVEPDTVVLNPVGGSVLDTGVVSFTGTASDDDSGVAEVLVAVRDRDTRLWLQADGTFAAGIHLAAATLDAPGTTSTNWTLDVTLPVGNYSVTPRAVDGVGNTESDRPWTGFSVADPVTDFVEPDTIVLNPIGGSTLPAGDVTFAGTASDDSSGVAAVLVAVRDRDTRLWLQADGTFAAGIYLAPAILDAPGGLSTNWTLDVTLPAGNYSVTPRSVDGAGNTEADRPWTGFSIS